jgi:hypothetical protein
MGDARLSLHPNNQTLDMNEITGTTRDFRKSILRYTGIGIELTRLTVTVVKVLHFIDGIKLYVRCSSGNRVGLPYASCCTNSWYFLANLDFDWRLLRRRPSLTWPGLVRARVVNTHCGIDGSE